MRVALREIASTSDTVTLGADGVPAKLPAVSYRTRTGALLRIGGVVRGAFDREHTCFALPAGAAGPLELEVERRALPQSGLPAGDGVRWRWLLARAAEPAARAIAFASAGAFRVQPAPQAPGHLALVGHSHLDVAWLWTYGEAIRKATRTFATAVRQLESNPTFVFTQTTPQLFADVSDAQPELFARMRTLARSGRLDTSGAAMWVECDCNLPSGESLLRQLIFGMRYVEREFGTPPTVAWLPDSFGFANTLPTLLRHAGIGAFGTTKLGWNDSTDFPHPRFWWEGPDGSRVAAASVASIEGGFAPRRVARARSRGDLLLVGRGDGGGGVADDVLAAAPGHGTFTTLAEWFATLPNGPLPVVSDELYLEEHRGTLTTHRDVKVRNARLERALVDTELGLAWAVALRATPFFVAEARAQLETAWRLTLRAQFHDVLPGSAIGAVYRDAQCDFDRADALVAAVNANVTHALPRAAPRAAPADVAPQRERGGYRLANGTIDAWIGPDGTLRELRFANGANLVRRALALALYRDRPRRWDAWNLDRRYRSQPRRVRTELGADGDGVVVGYRFGGSAAALRVSLGADAKALRVELAVAWYERHRVLRLENAFAFAATNARFGSPHGSIERSARPRSRAERAKFEACGQRFACVSHAGGGVAVLTCDTYGWSVEGRRRTKLGNSLLRAPVWPDPDADRGEHEFAFEIVPFARASVGELEARWQRFAADEHDNVAMFASDDPAIVVVATKPADDGDGVVVRARECEGSARIAHLRCAVRARDVACVDALERVTVGEAKFAGESIVAAFRPYEIRSFRVRVGAA